jgi:hypothetical protein
MKAIALLIVASLSVPAHGADLAAMFMASPEAAVVAKSAPKPLLVVKQPGPTWNQNGHTATVDHLVNVHGIDRATAVRMTPAQRDIAHSNAHNAARAAASSGCPGGVCPSSSRSRGFRLFRR